MDDNCLDLSSQDLLEISESVIEAKPEKLILDDNLITVLPLTVCEKLSYLSSLSLVNNKIKTLPPEIDRLSSLRELMLGWNLLTELPISIGKLKQLEKLCVIHNKLESFPESLSLLQNLSELIADENAIQTLPLTFGQLVKLSHLSLVDNNIRCLPESFGNLVSLKKLSIRYNSLTSLPSSFQNLSAVESIDLSFNELDTLPEKFSSASILKTIRISNNYLSVLPQWISRLPKVTDIYLDHNALQGNPFQEDFGDVCKCLENLDLRGNKISGLPSSFGNLSNLKILLLGPEDEIKLTYFCNSIARLPDSFPLLCNLTSLELDKNNLTELPDNFGCLSSLIHLDLRYNRIRMLPDSFCELKHLEKCLLSANCLSSLPHNFGSLSSLKLLKLNDNMLLDLPESFWDLCVECLDLSFNKLKENPCPEVLSESMKQLHIEENDFNSSIDNDLDINVCKSCIDKLQCDCQEQINSASQTACLVNGNDESDSKRYENVLSSSPNHPHCPLINHEDDKNRNNTSHLMDGCQDINHTSASLASEESLEVSCNNSEEEYDTAEDSECWGLNENVKNSIKDSVLAETSSWKNFENLSDSDWENETFENARNFQRTYMHPAKDELSAFVPADIHARLISRAEVWHCVEDGQFDDADL